MFPSEIEREEVRQKIRKVLTLADRFFTHHNFDGMPQRVKRVISNQCHDGSPKIRIRAGSARSLKRGRSAEEAK